MLEYIVKVEPKDKSSSRFVCKTLGIFNLRLLAVNFVPAVTQASNYLAIPFRVVGAFWS